MIKTLAIDIALIPDAKTSREWLAINEIAYKSWPAGFQFGHKHLPHLTLLQAYIDETRLGDFHIQLDEQMKSWDLTSFKELLPSGFTKKRAIEPNVDVLYLDVEKTDLLKNLHEGLADLGQQYHVPHFDEECFFEEKASPETQGWVNNFLHVASYDNYSPHVTLGFALENEAETIFNKFELPKKIVFESFVSAQLGNHCTVSSNVFRKLKI